MDTLPNPLSMAIEQYQRRALQSSMDYQALSTQPDDASSTLPLDHYRTRFQEAVESTLTELKYCTAVLQDASNGQHADLLQGEFADEESPLHIAIKDTLHTAKQRYEHLASVQGVVSDLASGTAPAAVREQTLGGYIASITGERDSARDNFDTLNVLYHSIVPSESTPDPEGERRAVGELERATGSVEEGVSDLVRRYQGLQRELAELQGTLAQSRQEYETLERIHGETEDELSGKKSDLETALEREHSLQKQLADVETSYTTLNGDYDTLHGVHSSLTDMHTQLTAVQGQLRREHDTLQGDYRQQSADYVLEQARTQSLEQQLAAAEQRITRMTEQQAVLRSTNTKLLEKKLAAERARAAQAASIANILDNIPQKG
ncbi:MAG: hypothetical protein AABX37_01960 [Nanoarchaeota archaeon]